MKKGFLASGITTCEGCAMELIARIVFEAAGENTVAVIPPGCGAILAGYNGETPLELPVVMSNLEATAAFASGIRAGLDILGKPEVRVLGFAGDGGTADIGLQSLSGAVERNER
ncbi:MAG: pyruvate synthase subunit beta, partial [Firmicutes bacterium]|nr:pyruvate synthase subunit beta [Candidatus Fermentithermobacillaceae bacterium]